MFQQNFRNMVILQVSLVLLIWAFIPLGSFPSLQMTMQGFSDLMYKEGLIQETMASMKLYGVSIALVALTSILISYAAVLPKFKGVDLGLIFKPLAALAAKARVLSPVGFQLLFQILTPDMWWLKVTVMVFTVSPWFICSLNSMLEKIHKSDIEYAETLRFSTWRTFWEVKFLGNLHNILDYFGQTAAMGWMMITVVEKISKCDGGIGTLLAGTERFHEIGKIFAIQLMLILPLSVIWDWVIKYVRSAFCPYAVMEENEQ